MHISRSTEYQRGIVFLRYVVLYFEKRVARKKEREEREEPQFNSRKASKMKGFL